MTRVAAADAAASKAELDICSEEEEVMKLLAEGRMPITDNTGGSRTHDSNVCMGAKLMDVCS